MAEPEVEAAATTALPRRHLRVEPVMGMPVSIDVRGADAGEDRREALAAALDEAFALLRTVDARFSTYQAGSEVRRLARGELCEDAVSPELREVLGLCERVRRHSDGAFDIRAAGLPLVPDPSGLVKGWAVERVARLLRARGLRDLCVNAGGDVRVLGAAEPDSGRAWRVGVRDPADRLRVVAAVHAPLEGCAVATSGTTSAASTSWTPTAGSRRGAWPARPWWGPI
jgi:thiamine biosynthesis lipoprotein